MHIPPADYWMQLAGSLINLDHFLKQRLILMFNLLIALCFLILVLHSFAFSILGFSS